MSTYPTEIMKIPGLDAFTAQVMKIPAFDCRQNICPACDAGRKGDHGIDSELWVFTLVDEDKTMALSLTIATPYYTEGTDVSVDSQVFRSRNLALCLNWRSDEGSIAGQTKPHNDCPYLGNNCHPAGSWGLVADGFFKEHFLVDDEAEQSTAFWLALEALADELIEPLKPMQQLEQCQCCDGKGVMFIKDAPQTPDQQQQQELD